MAEPTKTPTPSTAPKAEKPAVKAPAKAPEPAKPTAKTPPAKPAPPTTGKKTGAAAKAGAKPAPKAGGEKKDDVKIVDKPTLKLHRPRDKPKLSAAVVKGLSQRAEIAGRRPRFRRQQWYEYKRLANSGWRRPTGVDSAMRRHFGYEQSVVRVGFRGPVAVRGLHPSGFEEVRIETLADLSRVDPSKQAARVSGNLGTRNLKLVYAEADKRKIRILNRRDLK